MEPVAKAINPFPSTNYYNRDLKLGTVSEDAELAMISPST
jgi:hypothetical protein